MFSDKPLFHLVPWEWLKVVSCGKPNNKPPQNHNFYGWDFNHPPITGHGFCFTIGPNWASHSPPKGGDFHVGKELIGSSTDVTRCHICHQTRLGTDNSSITGRCSIDDLNIATVWKWKKQLVPLKHWACRNGPQKGCTFDCQTMYIYSWPDVCLLENNNYNHM